MANDELCVTVTLRNNLLLARRQALGMSQKAVANAIGIDVNRYCGLESMRLKPVVSAGARWSKAAEAIARFYEVEPQDLWPDTILGVVANRITSTVSARDVRLMCYPETIAPSASEEYDKIELKAAISKAIQSLPARERQALTLGFGLDDGVDRTDREVGATIGRKDDPGRALKPGSAGVLIANALRRLRVGPGHKRLRALYDDA